MNRKCPKAGSMCLVYSRRDSYLLNTSKARAHLYDGSPDSFQTENSYTVGIEPGISLTEVRILTNELNVINGRANHLLHIVSQINI